MPARQRFTVGDITIDAGTSQTVELPVSVLSDHTPVSMSAHVTHGKSDGPVMFVSAGIHGDEVIGDDIGSRMLRANNLRRIRRRVIVVEKVNSDGFING